jgi:hypothetical protein
MEVKRRSFSSTHSRSGVRTLLTLILTAWEFKKAFTVKMKISPGWVKQNIKKKNASQKI